MPVFEYSALKQNGKKTSGIIDSESLSAARQKLRDKNLFPVSLKEAKTGIQKKESSSFLKNLSFGRVKPAETTMMTRQLATLLSAGFPLVSAINTLIPQTKSQVFQKVLSQIKDSIEEGNSFAEALSIYPGIFSPVYRNMVRAGESSGTLDVVLQRLADISENQQALNSRIKAALAYPIIMTIIGTCVLFFLMVYIVPGITSIFTEMEQSLPTPTVIMITTSDFLKTFWWLIVLLIVFSFFMYDRVKRTEKGSFLIDKTILNIPATGQLVTKLSTARFSMTLGSLLANGVPMLTALGIVKNVVGNVLVADAINEASKEVEQGHPLGTSLDKADVFPYLAIQMIQVGEQSGELENMLEKIADIYEKEVETTIVSLTSLLEPIIILVMGAVVGMIVLSVCLPIFEMNQLVK